MHYVEKLSKDKKLKKLIDKHGTFNLDRKNNICIYLCYSIMSQQLSTKVARVIRQRFLDLYGGKEPTPQQIVDTPFEKLRGIGLSNAKVNYVQNVARFELEKGMDAEMLSGMANEQVIEYLTSIKGVGRWTTEMLLMFALGREDVFAIDDLGIQTAMISLYNLDIKDKKKLKEELIRISAKWKPYRTYACMYMWEHKDNGLQSKNEKVKSKKGSGERKTSKVKRETSNGRRKTLNVKRKAKG